MHLNTNIYSVVSIYISLKKFKNLQNAEQLQLVFALFK